MAGGAHIDDAERRRRVVVRHHLAGTARSVAQATRDLVAVHSSDPLTPHLAMWARVPDVTTTEVEAALYERRDLWRLHSIRRTLWVVDALDGPTHLVGATADIARTDRRKLHGWVGDSLTLDDPAAWLSGLAGEVRAALAGREPMSTTELQEAVPELATTITIGSGRWTQEQRVASRLLYLMAMDGEIVRGRPLGSWRASQYRWALPQHWFDPVPPPVEDPVQARADLVGGYLARFGPVTTDDVRWWTGWTVAKVRAALTACGAGEVDLDGGPTGWVLPGDEGPEEGAEEDTVTLLPGLDPTAMGWKERAWYLGDHTTFGRTLFDRNGNIGPTIWLDGMVVGGWAQRGSGEVITRLLVDVGAEHRDRIARRAAELQSWLGEHVVIPRFRTPLEKELADG